MEGTGERAAQHSFSRAALRAAGCEGGQQWDSGRGAGANVTSPGGELRPHGALGGLLSGAFLPEASSRLSPSAPASPALFPPLPPGLELGSGRVLLPKRLLQQAGG